jgi:Tol biopolymer transport system component
VEPSKDIWIKLVSGMEARRVTSSRDEDWTPSWSPDGGRIAFVRFAPGVDLESGAGAVYLVSALGGGERRLGDFPAAFSQLSWSPDGRFVAARRARSAAESVPRASGIYLVPVDGSEPRSLTVPPQPGWDKHPAFSPDGRHLAYAACSGQVTPSCDVNVIDLDGERRPASAPRRLTSNRVAIHGLAWTRDGRSIVYAPSWMAFEGRGMGASVWRVRADGRSPAQRIESIPPGAYAPATMPALDRLLFVHDRADVDVYRFTGKGPPEPVIASSSVDYGPRISPDGRHIVFESWRSGTAFKEIWLAELDGSNPVQLTHVTEDHQSAASGTGAPFWSPDGTYVAHMREEPGRGPGATNLWVISVAGGSDRRLTAQTRRLGPPVWSRDGYIYFRQPRPGGTDYFRIPEIGGAPQRVTQNGALMAEVSWDAKQLLYSQKEGIGPLFLLNLESGQERQLEECAYSRNLASSPGAFYSIGCADGPDKPLYRWDMGSGRRELLGSLTNVNLGLTVSRDGKTILYARENTSGADLMLIESFR